MCTSHSCSPNDQASANRAWLAERAIRVVNLIGSPGAGKTALLEATIPGLGETASVIDGDHATERDADRIRAMGCAAVQLNTGTGCYLDAKMVADGLEQLTPRAGSLVFIENVGNLVCPALFDLGEQAKVVVLSVAEGDDKPIKYPHVFDAASLLVLSKIDLLPYVRFDVERCIAYAHRVNPRIEVCRVSAETGEGMESWLGWLGGVGRPPADFSRPRLEARA